MKTAISIMLTTVLAASLAAAGGTGPVSSPNDGVLVVAHGGGPDWDNQVKDAIAPLRERRLIEVGFLLTRTGETPQAGYDALVRAGAKRIAIVPLLVSSHSDHYEEVRFVGRARPDYPHAEHTQVQQLQGTAEIVGVASGMDSDELVEEALADRAKRISRNVASEHLVLVAHGPNEDAEAELWMSDLESVAQGIKQRLGLSGAESKLLRDDAPPPVKAAALAALRASVESASERGDVLVVPVLVARGKISAQIPEILGGAKYRWDGTPLLPHPAIARWIEKQADSLLGGKDRAAAEAISPAELVVVTATRTPHTTADSPVETTVVPQREITSLSPRSVADVLKRQTGIDVLPTLGGEGVRIDGCEPKHVLFMLDGIRIGGRIAGAIDASTLPVESIERVEIVRGATSALYGSDAIGGVVNMVTSTSEGTLRAGVTGGLETLGGRSFAGDLAFRNSGWAFTTTAKIQHRDSYDLTPESPGTTGSEFDRIAAFIKVEGDVGAARVRVLSQIYDESALDITPGRSVLYEDETRDRRVTSGVAVEMKPAENGNLSLRASHSRFWHDFERSGISGGLISADEDTQSFADLQAQYDHAVSRHLLTFGGGFERSSISATRVPEGSRSMDNPTFFAQNEIQLLPRLSLLAGVRYDSNSVHGNAVSPRAGISFRPSSAITVRIAYGEGFKAPDFKELYVDYSNRAAGYQIVGEPDLRPEKSRSLTASLSATAGRDMSFRAALFRNRVRNLIESYFHHYDPISKLVVFSYQNVAEAEVTGVELEGSRSFLMPGLAVAVSYTGMRARDSQTGNALFLRPTHSGILKLAYDSTHTTASVNVRAVGARWFADQDGDERPDEKAPSYALVDFGASRRIAAGLELFGGIENILDRTHPRYLPLEGRRIFGGFRYAFERE